MPSEQFLSLIICFIRWQCLVCTRPTHWVRYFVLTP